jgi:hypothetical protein
MKASLFDKNGLIPGEPTWSKDLSEIDSYKNMSRGLNFYAGCCSKKDIKEDLFHYLKERNYDNAKLKKLKQNYDDVCFTVYKLARMINLGMKEQQMNTSFILDECDKAVKRIPDVEEVAENISKPKVISPLQRLQDKVSETVIADLEEMIDSWTKDLTKNASPIDVKTAVQKYDIPLKGYAFVMNWLKKYQKEITEAVEKTDEYSVESYSHIKASVLKSWKKSFDTMIKDLEEIELKRKKIRSKTRNKKRAPKNRFQAITQMNKKVKSLKYLDKDSDYSIKSIDPKEIIGAKDLWVFNTKNQQLVYFTALGREGLDIKGTTIINYNDKLSYRMKLRKPENVLPHIKPSAGETKIANVIKDLKTKKYETTGRINNNIVLLKASK